MPNAHEVESGGTVLGKVEPAASPVNVAFSSDERGTVGLAVAVQSLLRHTKRSVNVWIIEDGIGEDTQKRLRASWRGADELAQIRFVSRSELPIKVPTWWGTNDWPRAACYRFQLSEVLPQTVARCIYLDIDVLVGTDVGDLYDLDMQGFPIAMVDGLMKVEADRKYIISLGMDPNHYGNSGVILMDLDAWRRENHATRLIDHARSMRPDLWFFDQDVLNDYFKDQFLLLEWRWNARDAALSPEGIIQHFAGAPKPWDMNPDQVTLTGLIAWHRARAENEFESVPPSLAKRIKRRIDVQVARIQRRLRRNLRPTQ
jgi:lipopolysaccharide biosynthesis glycosyltransferase